MAALTSIPIDCWLCQTKYDVPAQLHITPPNEEGWYGERLIGNLWAWVDQRPIQAHVQGHWPVLVFCFFMWRAFIDVSGIDPLEQFRRMR